MPGSGSVRRLNTWFGAKQFSVAEPSFRPKSRAVANPLNGNSANAACVDWPTPIVSSSGGTTSKVVLRLDLTMNPAAFHVEIWYL